MKIRPIKAHLQEPVTTEGAKGARIRVLIGPEDGATTFHMRHFEVQAGGCTPYHEHEHEHEVLVLKGGGLVKGVEGDRPFKQGDVIFIPGGEKHQFLNNGDGPCEFICLIPAPRTCGC